MTPEQVANVIWSLVALVGIGGFWLYAVIGLLVTKRYLFERKTESEYETELVALEGRRR